MSASGGHHGFSFYHLLPNGEENAHVYGAVAVSAVVLLTSGLAARKLAAARKGSDQGLVPDAKVTLRNFFEIVAESLYRLVENTMGSHDAKKFYPFIGAIFMFIFVSNLSGLLPGVLPPTNNMNTTLALGTVVFIYYNYLGIKEHGWGYLKHFLGPVWWLAPLMLVIELVSHFVRPVSLALRLRGNIEGDHMVLASFSQLVPFGVPIPFYALGIFVSFIQAFVFSLLTMVYISLANAHDH